MRCYFSFPTVKTLIYKDDINVGKTPTGGFTDTYVFRLAETYLMRAEAYYWLGNLPLAKEDVNEIRRRAFLKAQLGHDGYSLGNFSEKNWYYDRIMEKNNFFAEEYFYSTNAFIMKPYHVLWPVPLTAITSNTQGRINQNIGYFGAEDNIPVE